MKIYASVACYKDAQPGHELAYAMLGLIGVGLVESALNAGLGVALLLDIKSNEVTAQVAPFILMVRVGRGECAANVS